MKILFVGALWTGSNALSLANGFAELGEDVRAVDTTCISRPTRYGPHWVLNKTGGPDALQRRSRIMSDFRHACRQWRPDVLICFKTITLSQDELLAPAIPFKVAYSHDDMTNPENTTLDYLQHESRWDLIVTTKRHNVQEIADRTAHSTVVKHVMSAYDPAWHHRVTRASAAGLQLASFIGHFRPDRHGLMSDLAKRYDRRLAIYGDGWRRRAFRTDLHRASLHRPVYGESFSTAVAQSLGSLVLLNSANRDTHTCRSFEVPACGGTFIGERTDEHREMLEEGREALLFDCHLELVDHLSRIERSPKEAADIAERGWQRISRRGNNTYADRAREVLDTITSGLDQ